MEKYHFSIQLNPRYSAAIHHFKCDKPKRVVLMIHGAVENGRIFYSNSGKGLAPFLCNSDSDVFVIDLPGRGESQPHSSSKLIHSQSDFVIRDFPKLITEIRKHVGSNMPWHGVGHSWGGVLWIASLVRHPVPEIKSLVFFGVKRRIAIRSIKKWWMVDFYWKFVGKFISRFYGYVPARKWKLGSDDEPIIFSNQTMLWVDEKPWVDPEDGFDYLANIANVQLPPVLSMTGYADKILGNPNDVADFISEIGIKDKQLLILGTKQGNHLDYDHINILTKPVAKDDGYRFALDWITKHDK